VNEGEYEVIGLELSDLKVELYWEFCETDSMLVIYGPAGTWGPLLLILQSINERRVSAQRSHDQDNSFIWERDKVP
jgi:hypothetical protein